MTIALTRGAPEPAMLPTELLQDTTEIAAKTYGTDALGYGNAQGFLPLRHWIAKQTMHPAENVIVGNGSMNLISYLMSYRIQAGDRVIIENPTYDRAITLLKQLGASINAIDLESDGLQTGTLEEHFATHKPKLIYLINDFHNPAGTSTSLEKRQVIANLAEQHDCWIVDDSAYYTLRYRGQNITPMRELAPRHTFTAGTFSKLIAPGLRTGWLLVPDEHYANFVNYLEMRYIGTNFYVQSIVTALVNHDAFPSHLAHLIKTYTRRLDTAVAALNQHIAPLGGTWTTPEGGFFIGLTLPPTPKPIWEAPARDQLKLLNGDEFFVGRQNTNFVRLPFCSLNENDFVQGIERLAEAYQRL